MLVNRRGWSPFVDCRDCGRAWMCPQLRRDAHAAPRRRRRSGCVCHHCGHAEPAPHACPDCGSTAVARHGAGTQRLEAELREALAPLPVFRLDATPAAASMGSRRCSSASRRRPPGCWSGRRWSLRATTSRRWSLRSSRTPTRRCGSPTSGPRSARSRSSPQLAAAAAAARAGGACWSRPCAPGRQPAARCRSRRRWLSGGGARAPPRAALSALLDPDPRLIASALEQASPTRPRGSSCTHLRRPRSARPRAAVPRQGSLPLHAGGEDRRPGRAVQAVGEAVRGVATQRSLRGVKFCGRRRSAMNAESECPFCKRLRRHGVARQPRARGGVSRRVPGQSRATASSSPAATSPTSSSCPVRSRRRCGAGVLNGLSPRATRSAPPASRCTG